jgi:hypothetical protein
MADFRDFLHAQAKPKPRPSARRWGGPFADRQSRYEDVVADFTERPLMSHCSCGACRAGRLPELPEGMAETFARWEPYAYDRIEEEEEGDS